MFWNANVPKKVKFFGWRVARDNLATKRNKMRRSLERDGMCNICGREEEDSFHATVNCTKARALRYEMRKHWSLPPENNFVYSGPEWLQNLLLNLSQSERSKVLMLLWRSWHLRNDIVHGKGQETIARSAAFLTRYDNFLQDPGESRSTGPPLENHLTNSAVKTDVLLSLDNNRNMNNTKATWTPPGISKLKMNVDAAFCKETGGTTAGIVFRNHLGETVAAASYVLEKCADVEEAEATAVWAGLNLASHCNLMPGIVESDNAGVVNILNSKRATLGPNWHIYRNIDTLRRLFSDCGFSKVPRSHNESAHELASLAKRTSNSAVWLAPIPSFISDICNRDVVNASFVNE
jgi:ribonuclease HI